MPLVRNHACARSRRPSHVESPQRPDGATCRQISHSELSSPNSSPPPSATGEGSSEDEVMLCTSLHGWLLKKHNSPKLMVRQWSWRYFYMDDDRGVLIYGKGPTRQMRTQIVLSDIRALHMLDEPAHAFQIRVAPSYDFSQLTIAADDREECLMWFNQLNKRVSRWKERGQALIVAEKDAAKHTTVEIGKGLSECFMAQGEGCEEGASEDVLDQPSEEGASQRMATLHASGVAVGRTSTLMEEGRLENQGGAEEERGEHRHAQLLLARVLADFESEHPLELSVRSGEILLLTGEIAPEGWLHVITGSTNGIVPASYVRIAPATGMLGLTDRPPSPGGCEVMPIACGDDESPDSEGGWSEEGTHDAEGCGKQVEGRETESHVAQAVGDGIEADEDFVNENWDSDCEGDVHLH
ncbi:MAG: hypothetical protein SGPRY_008452 [Prymnesium sp.]